MIGVFAYGLIYELTTEDEIAKHQGEDYLKEVLKKKAEILEEETE